MWPFSGERGGENVKFGVNGLGLDDYDLHSSPGYDIKTRSDQG